MDENKQYILNEVYKQEIAKFTKEDFELVRANIVKWAVNQYDNVVFKQGGSTNESKS